MPHEVSDGGGLKDGLDPPARDELALQAVAWEDQVLAEAARLAAGRQAGSQRDPITPHDIVRAVHNVDGLPAIHEQPRQAVAFRVVSYLLAILSGYFLNNIDKAWGSIGFAITSTLGALTGWYGEQASRKKERR